MIISRKKPGTEYNYPEHWTGLKRARGKFLYAIGFDPLTDKERIAVRHIRDLQDASNFSVETVHLKDS